MSRKRLIIRVEELKENNPIPEEVEIVQSDDVIPEGEEQQNIPHPDTDPTYQPPVYVESSLNEGEYPNTYVDHTIEPDELNKALDVIISTCFQQKTSTITVDLDERERENSMVEREMSLSEIEQILGCKVKIVNKEDWSDYERE